MQNYCVADLMENETASFVRYVFSNQSHRSDRSYYLMIEFLYYLINLYFDQLILYYSYLYIFSNFIYIRI